MDLTGTGLGLNRWIAGRATGPKGGLVVPAADFAELLTRFRERAGIGQEELARRAGLSVKAVRTLERGERRHPYPHTVRALVTALDLAADERSELLATLTYVRSPVGDAIQPGPNDAQRAAAWSLHIELVTRVSVAGLTQDEGMLREALSSLHSLFFTARAILRDHGPALAYPRGSGVSVYELTTKMLDEVLRPVLSEWHPLLVDHEARRPLGVAPCEHERAWARNRDMRAALDALRTDLSWYAQTFAQIAGFPGTS